jgi:hypothetical protein
MSEETVELYGKIDHFKMLLYLSFKGGALATYYGILMIIMYFKSQNSDAAIRSITTFRVMTFSIMIINITAPSITV